MKNNQQINMEEILMEMDNENKIYLDHLIFIDGIYLQNPLCKDEELTETERIILEKQKAGKGWR